MRRATKKAPETVRAYHAYPLDTQDIEHLVAEAEVRGARWMHAACYGGDSDYSARRAHDVCVEARAVAKGGEHG